MNGFNTHALNVALWQVGECGLCPTPVQDRMQMDFTGKWGLPSLESPGPLASLYCTFTRAAWSPLSSIPSHLPTQLSAVSSKITSRECRLKAWLDTRKSRLAGLERQSYALKRQVAPFKIPPCPSASAHAPSNSPHNICCGSSCPVPALARAQEWAVPAAAGSSPLSSTTALEQSDAETANPAHSKGVSSYSSH